LVNANGEPSDVNQMFVAAKYARDTRIMHDPALNQFHCYDPETGLWRPKTEARLLVDLGLALRVMLNDCGCNMLLRKCTGGLLGQILRLLKGMAEQPDAFRQVKQIIHVGNGVLDPGTNPPAFRGFSPGYRSRNRTEVNYVEGAACPRFLDELLRPALGDADISLLQRYAGQCLLGRNLSQRILLIRGTPGGGKGTAVKVIENIIGTHNIQQLRVQHLTGRFELGAYDGKTLLCGRDVPGNFLNTSAAHVLKALVGGDRLSGEKKGVNRRSDLTGEYNVIITSNTHLHVRLDGDSGAWRRRLLILDYELPAPAKPIADFDRVLVDAEGPGILNWCIAGARRLLDELDADGRVQLTEAQSRRVDALLCESDSVRHFITAALVRDGAADVTVQELLPAYASFCERQGWHAVTVRQFENELSDLMMEVHRVTKRTDIKRHDRNQRGFAHVRLK
jgi:P4 family phage/plasmid primase-like protien